jgi:hypothetical protein
MDELHFADESSAIPETITAGQLGQLPRGGDRTEDPLPIWTVSASFRVFGG